MNIRLISRSIVPMLAALCLLAGCATPKDVTYLRGSENAEIFEIASTQDRAIKVEPFDKLSITVTCKDPALAKMFNLQVYSNSTQQRTNYSGGDEMRDYSVAMSSGLDAYTVTAAGTIDFPVLGTLKVEGMTRYELAGFIKGEIMGRGLIKDPIVTVEFLNIGVSVLGEVNKPGRFDLNADAITVLEALSLAGDMTIQGKRTNVKVLRKEGGKAQTYIIDISDTKKMLDSPAYFLKQGDVVYVEPNNMRKRQTTENGNSILGVSFWISVASLLTSAAILFKR